MADDPANPLHRTVFDTDDNGNVMNDPDESDIEIVEGMGEEVPLPAPVEAWLREQPIGLGQVTGTGDNLLHLAAADGRVDVVEWLLAAGVDPRTEDYAGEDALTLAIRHAHYPVANVLIRFTETADEPVAVASVAVPAEYIASADNSVGTVGADPAVVAPVPVHSDPMPPGADPAPGADETVETAPDPGQKRYTDIQGHRHEKARHHPEHVPARRHSTAHRHIPPERRLHQRGHSDNRLRPDRYG